MVETKILLKIANLRKYCILDLTSIKRFKTTMSTLKQRDGGVSLKLPLSTMQQQEEEEGVGGQNKQQQMTQEEGAQEPRKRHRRRKRKRKRRSKEGGGDGKEEDGEGGDGSDEDDVNGGEESEEAKYKRRQARKAAKRAARKAELCCGSERCGPKQGWWRRAAVGPFYKDSLTRCYCVASRNSFVSHAVATAFAPLTYETRVSHSLLFPFVNLSARRSFSFAAHVSPVPVLTVALWVVSLLLSIVLLCLPFLLHSICK